MNEKEYLNQAYKLEQRISSKLDLIQSLNDTAMSVTSVLGDSPVGGTRNVHRTQDILDKVVDLENEIQDEICRLIDTKKGIMHTIRAVENVDCQLLLEMRYLCYHTWEQIAVDLDYCMDNVYKLHRRALSMVEVPEEIRQ